MNNQGEIIIYENQNKDFEIQVRFENETVWLTQKQIAELYQTTPQNITLHLKKIYKEEEIEKKATCKEYLQVQMEGNRKVERRQQLYNLDAILSVGYRVNSKLGTRFRQWATQRLTDYLVKGYAINQKRLEQLQKVVEIIDQTGNKENLQLNEAKGLLDIINKYAQSFVLLNQFDRNGLELSNLNENITYEIKYKEAGIAIAELKNQLISNKEASELFGRQKDKSFEGILKAIIQTFDNKYLYPSIEEQAAHLLYFVIKNHPFTDGNKRIGAFLFIWFLQKNAHNFKQSGELKINDNALTALALLVAQSNPSEKEMMVKLIINLIKE